MSRRFLIVPALVAFAAAPLANASEQFTQRVTARESIARFAPRIELTALFARIADGGAAVETSDGVSAPMQVSEVLVARIGTDGKPVMACVDNEEAARRFLDAPIERAERRRAQEQ
ncbi:MAG TPA: hypothetical protein VF911_21165 [Thermoanaerobaculia bacterium]|jgi:hypothetical protein